MLSWNTLACLFGKSKKKKLKKKKRLGKPRLLEQLTKGTLL